MIGDTFGPTDAALRPPGSRRLLELDAVKQWQFKPAMLKGEAVPVIVQIEMTFTLK